MSGDFLSRNFTQNPLLVEAKRFRRRFLGESRQSTVYRVYLILSGVIYLLLIICAIAYREALTSSGVLEFQNAVFCLIVPAVTYGAVAGEREKRTWELLVVAPITKTQIILGKFLSASMVILAVAVLILPMAAIAFAKGSEQPWGVFFGVLDSVAFALAFAAGAIFISSRTNRSLTAQVLIYGSLFVWLAVIPVFVGAANIRSGSVAFFTWFHPFVSVLALCTGKIPGTNDSAGFLFSPLAQGLLYLAIIVIALEGAIYSISTADGGSGRFTNA